MMETLTRLGKETAERPGRSASVYPDLLANPLLHLALLTCLTLVLFGRSLGTYFLADDFGEVHYVHRIFHGEPWLFWMNFAGNYMQIDGMSVLRPFLLLSLVIDYLFWHGNAFGYYLSNVSSYTGCVLLLYLFTRQMTGHWTKGRSSAAALAAAALFAANPLHCESVSWVVGRVDMLSAVFYLIGLNAFLKMLDERSHSGRAHAAIFWQALTVVSFWAGLLVKEMAIGLPVMVTVLALYRRGDRNKLASSFFDALKLAQPLWLSTLLYFALRLVTLGTLTGGYVAGFGATQENQMLARWLDMDSWRRIFFPFNQAVFPDVTAFSNMLTVLYAAAFTCLAIRLVARQLPWRLLFVGAVWAFTTLLPIYKLFGIGYNLEGARFVYFFTMPAAFLISVLLLAPGTTSSGTDRESPGEAAESGNHMTTALVAVNGLILVLMVAAFSRITLKTNLQWVHAGREVRDVLRSAKEIGRLAPWGATVLLGLPKERAGTHMILNGQTFEAMLREPFSDGALCGRFSTFEPIMYGPPENINAARLKRTLGFSNSANIFVWSPSKRKFENVLLSGYGPAAPAAHAGAAKSDSAKTWRPYSLGHAHGYADGEGWVFNKTRDGDGLLLAELDLNPLSVDFVELKVKSLSASPIKFKVLWNLDFEKSEPHQNAAAFAEREVASEHTSSWRIVRIPASSKWRWFAAGNIKNLFIELPSGENRIEIKDVRLLPAKGIVPSVTAANCAPSGTGVSYAKPGRPIEIKVSTPDFSEAHSIRLNVSKPNFFFDNFPGDARLQAIASQIVVERSSDNQTIRLDPSKLGKHGYVQISATALSQDGAVKGEESDPLTIRLP